MTSICLTFDPKRIETSNYGSEAWFTFWSAIREKDLGIGARLYCGDLVSISPGAYGILIESESSDLIVEVKKRFSSSEAYNKISGSRPFIEGISAVNARLVKAGTIDSHCTLVGGESDWARVELASVKLPDLRKVYVKNLTVTTQRRPVPASTRTNKLQAVTGMPALKELLKAQFTAERQFVSLTPEEVCDLVDLCAGHFYVAWELSGTVYTESFVKINFMEKSVEQRAVQFQGLFNFPSLSDVDRLIREYVGYSKEFLNVKDIRALNFIGPKDVRFNDYGKAWMEKENLSGDILWKYIHLRWAQLGLPSGEPLAQSILEQPTIPKMAASNFAPSSQGAAGGGELERVATLLKDNPDWVSSKNQHGLTPLHIAVRDGMTGVVEFLLSNGADVNGRTSITMTPLHIAAEWGRRDVAELLLSKGADVNARQGNGNTALHLAMNKGSMPIMELLISKGADVNARWFGDQGSTPLQMAMRRGDKDVADFLRNHGGVE